MMSSLQPVTDTQRRRIVIIPRTVAVFGNRIHDTVSSTLASQPQLKRRYGVLIGNDLASQPGHHTFDRVVLSILADGPNSRITPVDYEVCLLFSSTLESATATPNIFYDDNLRQLNVYLYNFSIPKNEKKNENDQPVIVIRQYFEDVCLQCFSQVQDKHLKRGIFFRMTKSLPIEIEHQHDFDTHQLDYLEAPPVFNCLP